MIFERNNKMMGNRRCAVIMYGNWQELLKGKGKMTKYRLKLPRILGEGCVLQQGKQTRIWGWCEPGQQVAVNFFEKEKHAVIQVRENLMN